MTDLEAIFDELGIAEYLQSFLEQGFDSWETILDITESDFDALNVKLGHRRKLQRRIAATRGISNTQALASPKRGTPSLEDKPPEESKGTTPRPEARDGGNSSNQPSGKRKYRRHPKPDENAPERPPSAYVIFSNKMREDLKGRSLSFTEIAKLVGENWQNLTPSEKEPYEQQAFAAKEKYTIELSEYRQTESYRSYADYLVDFKAKQQQQQEGNLEASLDHPKRPKLDPHPSIGSTSTTKSSSSVVSRELSQETSSGSKTRSLPLSSVSAPWGTNDSASGQPLTVASNHGSPSVHSAPSLSGYGDTILGTTAHSASWREQPRPLEMPLPIHGYRPAERNATQPMILNTPDSQMQFGHSFQSQQRSIGGFTPPSLVSESTVSTLKSVGSAGSGDSRQTSSPYYTPRTPLDSSRDRPSLPIPSIYAGQKPPATFETKLPPIRHPSLSPQSSINVPYNSASGILAMDYFTPSSASQRNSFPTQNRPQAVSQNSSFTQRPVASADEENAPLDPVSALIRAGEIVSNQGRQQQPPHHQHHSQAQHQRFTHSRQSSQPPR